MDNMIFRLIPPNLEKLSFLIYRIENPRFLRLAIQAAVGNLGSFLTNFLFAFHKSSFVCIYIQLSGVVLVTIAIRIARSGDKEILPDTSSET